MCVRRNSNGYLSLARLTCHCASSCFRPRERIDFGSNCGLIKIKQNQWHAEIINNTHHLSLSFAPAEKVDDLRTSPISSRQKLKLLIVHM